MGEIVQKKIMTVRPENIIEARFSLSNKQNSIVDIVLSKLRDDDNLTYELDVKEYEYLIKTDTSNIYRDFKKAVKGFEKAGVNIFDKETKEETWFAWFSKIKYKDKQGKIEVNIDKDFKKILYEVKKKIFFDLAYTLNMKSNYSQRVYYYMKSFEDTGWRIDLIDDLTKKLEAPESYKNFANMKKYVLDKAKEEINEITDILFDYEPVKSGRKVTHIKSTIKSKNKNIINYKKMSVEFIIATIGDLIDGEIDAKKILNALDYAVKESKNPKNKKEEITNIEEYFQTQVDITTRYFHNNKKAPFIALLITAIKQGWNYSENKQLSFGSFNNFESRDIYNNPQQMKLLEEKLLGWDKDDEEVAIDVEAK